MSLRKPWFILAAISIAAFATVSSLKVPIKEYDVPTPHARPHDPALAPDGALWVTEQMANKLGRLDPATGKFREYPLKTPDSGPHGLVADKQGNIWFRRHLCRVRREAESEESSDYRVRLAGRHEDRPAHARF